jgi:hypothetical protein
MKINLYLIVGVAWFFLNFGIIVSCYGKLPTHPNEPYGWDFVVFGFFFMASFFVLGWLAAKHDRK